MLVLSQRRRMEALVGADRVAAAIDTLEPAMRRDYLDASALGWVPQPAVREVTRAVAQSAGLTGEALVERIVRDSVLELCQGPWNILLRLTSDEALIERAASLFARSFDGGTIRARRTSDAVEIVLEGWPRPDRMDLVSIRAGIAATLEAVDRRAVIEMGAQPGGARYVVRVVT